MYLISISRLIIMLRYQYTEPGHLKRFSDSLMNLLLKIQST